MVDFDTYASCQGCPYRSTEPNCHMHCEGYLARTEARRERNRLQRERGCWLPETEHNRRIRNIQSARHNRRRGS